MAAIPGGFGGIDITSPEFGRAISGAFEVGERLPEQEGEWGQYKSRREERDAFEAYVEAVAPRTGMRELRVFFGTYKSHGLYESWVKIGRPIDPGVKPLPREIVEDLADKGITEEMLEAARLPIAPPPTPREQIRIQLQAAEEVAGAPPLGGVGRPESERPLPGETSAEWRIRLDRQSAILGDPVQEEHLGFKGFWGKDGYFYTWDEFTGRNRQIDFDASRVVEPEAEAPPGETEAQRLSRERLRRQFETTEERLGEEFRLTRESQEESRRLEQERFGQQLTAQREERLAQLAAQPISWLQHAALSGQQPVVQPWMKPLMRSGQNLQVGQPIPGFQPGAPGGATEQGGFLPGTATPSPLGTQFANLPELRRPSAQLFARMGPTAQQQWLGFRQARTGVPPQEALFRQRQSGPPGAGRGGFQQQRLRV